MWKQQCAANVKYLQSDWDKSDPLSRGSRTKVKQVETILMWTTLKTGDSQYESASVWGGRRDWVTIHTGTTALHGQAVHFLPQVMQQHPRQVMAWRSETFLRRPWCSFRHDTSHDTCIPPSWACRTSIYLQAYTQCAQRVYKRDVTADSLHIERPKTCVRKFGFFLTI